MRFILTIGLLAGIIFYNDSILLKAYLLHDLLEDLPETQVNEIRWIDHEGWQELPHLRAGRSKKWTEARKLQFNSVPWPDLHACF